MGDEDILVDEEMEPNPDLNRITNDILGAAIEVHRTLGPGFAEAVYCKALEVEFAARGTRFRPQSSFDVTYKGVVVGQGKMDFLVDEKVILEIKAVEASRYILRKQSRTCVQRDTSSHCSSISTCGV